MLGANGSGKTTLALHLVGALERERGDGAWSAGRPVERDHLAEVRRRVGLVFQDPDDQILLPDGGRRRGPRPRQPGARPPPRSTPG